MKTILVREAREMGKEWVEHYGSQTPGFLGAFLKGSTKWAAPNATHSPSSDVDVCVVVDQVGQKITWPKLRYKDILLESGCIARSELGTAEDILQNPRMAGNFWHPVLLADSYGVLKVLGRQVNTQFAKRFWVEQRMHRAEDLALLWLNRIDKAESFPDKVTCWLFGTGVTTFILLTAGLRNLTVRRRYAESRKLLEEYGRLDIHEEMLSWLGCADMKMERVSHHLQALANAFDAVGEYIDPSFRFAADLHADARPVAINGSQELIDAGLHREAVFWLVATFSRCLQGLRNDVPQSIRALCQTGFGELLSDLGINSKLDLRNRAEQVYKTIPKLNAIAMNIVDRNQEIVD